MSEEQAPKTPIASGQQPTPQSKLDVFERVARIASLAAIPIVIPIALAFYSAQVQEHSQKESINRDYVQLSVSILKEKREDVNANLRDWAVDLLAEHSPTKMSSEVVQALKTGQILLPNLFSEPQTKTTAISPNGQFLATSDSRSFSLLSLKDNRRMMIADTVQPVTALQFTPEGNALAVGFIDGGVSIYSVLTNQQRMKLATSAAVMAIWFPTPESIEVLSQDSVLTIWGLPRGNLISRTKLGPEGNDRIPTP